MRRTLVPLLALCLAPALAAQDGRQKPNFYLELGFAFDELEYRTEGTPLDDEEDASHFRLRFDAVTDGGFGGGIDLMGTAAEDLFTETGTEPTDFDAGRVFPHLTFRFGGDRFTGMLRGGLLLAGSGIEGTLSGGEVRWDTVGFGLGFEGDVVIGRTGDTDWSLYGNVLIGGGETEIEVTPGGEEFDTDTGFLDFEAGLRVTINKFRAGAGFLFQRQLHDQSDVSGGAFVFEAESEFRGFLVTLGVVF